MRQDKGRYERSASMAVKLAGMILLGGSALAQNGGSTSTANMPDAQVEANVLKALAGTPQLANESITTNTVYGVVTLSGTVKNESTRTMAENLASRANGVKKVVDELTIGTGSADANASNPMLQSDGTMAPPAGQPQHAPDPDVYAAQQGITSQQGTNGAPQANTQDNSNYNQPQQPGYRQPYNAQSGNPNSQQQYGQPQPGPGYPQNGQTNPQNVQPPYQPGGYQRRPQQGPPPPPYGAQVAGKPVTVPPGALLRVRINEGLDSKHTQPGTPFDAVVLNDVVADGAVAIPRGASVQGHVTEAKSGGVIKGHGELSLQLTQVTLGGQTFPITSDVWERDSSDKGLQTVNNAIGLGAAGAIIGAIAGGGAGAAIGAGVGGAAGIGTSAASGSRQVLVPSEAILTFHLAQPAPVTTISQAEMDRLSYGVPVGAQQMQRRPPPPAYYGPVYYPRPYPYPY